MRPHKIGKKIYIPTPKKYNNNIKIPQGTVYQANNQPTKQKHIYTLYTHTPIIIYINLPTKNTRKY